MVRLRGGSRIADSRPRAVHTKGAAAKRSGGMPPSPPLNAFRSILVHFRTIFQHGNKLQSLLQISGSRLCHFPEAAAVIFLNVTLAHVMHIFVLGCEIIKRDIHKYIYTNYP